MECDDCVNMNQTVVLVIILQLSVLLAMLLDLSSSEGSSLRLGPKKVPERDAMSTRQKQNINKQRISVWVPKA